MWLAFLVVGFFFLLWRAQPAGASVTHAPSALPGPAQAAISAPVVPAPILPVDLVPAASVAKPVTPVLGAVAAPATHLAATPTAPATRITATVAAPAVTAATAPAVSTVTAVTAPAVSTVTAVTAPAVTAPVVTAVTAPVVPAVSALRAEVMPPERGGEPVPPPASGTRSAPGGTSPGDPSRIRPATAASPLAGAIAIPSGTVSGSAVAAGSPVAPRTGTVGQPSPHPSVSAPVPRAFVATTAAPAPGLSASKHLSAPDSLPALPPAAPSGATGSSAGPSGSSLTLHGDLHATGALPALLRQRAVVRSRGFRPVFYRFLIERPG